MRVAVILLSAAMALPFVALPAESSGVKALLDLLTTITEETAKSGARQTRKGAKAAKSGSPRDNPKGQSNFPVGSIFLISNSSAKAMRQYLDRNCGKEGQPQCSSASVVGGRSNEELFRGDAGGYSIIRDNNRKFCVASKSFNKTQSIAFGSSRTGNSELTKFISFSDLNWKLKGRKVFQASITIDGRKTSEGTFHASYGGKAITREITDNKHFLTAAQKGRVIRLLNDEEDVVLGFKLTGSSTALAGLNECMKAFIP
jgi:hypothetical protein